MHLAINNLQYRVRDYSPLPVVSKISLESKNIFAIRDDLLPGGTKQRAAIPYIHNEIKKGHRHFIYASPFSGFAQVALALCLPGSWG